MVEAAGIEPGNIPLFPFRSSAFIGLVMRFFRSLFLFENSQ